MRIERWIQGLHFLCSATTISAMAVGEQTRKPSIAPILETAQTPSSKKHNPSMKVSSPLLDQWREFEGLRETDLEEEYLNPFFQERPTLISRRLFEVTSTLYRAREEWLKGESVSEPDTYIADDGPANLDGKNELDSLELERSINLCTAVASLGPVAVKIGQTLSQRPDLVGPSAARALKRLQTKNIPFDNELAYAVMHESLNYWEGPLAPGIMSNNPNVDQDGPPLFAHMTKDSIACASLGQVYKATMHDGKEVAVKVQRPDALSCLAKDVQCFRFVFQLKANVEKIRSRFIRGKEDGSEGETESEIRGNGVTVGTVIDRVARDVKKELDYRIEAENSVRFRESLNFIGFVTTPDVVQATSRILTTEWIPGRHLEDLNKAEGLAMTRMAVEACTASICLTGYVHADPHEGNLMLHDDGRIVFLDFGLMSDVSITVMEGFARAITGLLSDDFVALTEAFVDVDFVTNPVRHRSGVDDVWRIDPKYGLPELAQELESAMRTTEGGVSQFGALATVLNKEISPRWLVFTPPYVILLTRTFLTLEGIARTVDPDFNIYEMAMPWAVRRTLSPSTQKGIDVFRSTLLTEKNRIQWQRLLDLTQVSKERNASPAPAVDQIQVSEIKQANQAERDGAKKAAMEDAVGTLLGSSEGKALRRVLKDLDSADFVSRLSSRDGRPLLQLAVGQLSFHLFKKRAPKKMVEELQGRSAPAKQSQPSIGMPIAIPIENVRPISDECIQLRKRQSRWNKRVRRHLIAHHTKRCLLRRRGLIATTRFAFVFAKVFMMTLVKRFRDGTDMDSQPAAAADN